MCALGKRTLDCGGNETAAGIVWPRSATSSRKVRWVSFYVSCRGVMLMKEEDTVRTTRCRPPFRPFSLSLSRSELGEAASGYKVNRSSGVGASLELNVSMELIRVNLPNAALLRQGAVTILVLVFLLAFASPKPSVAARCPDEVCRKDPHCIYHRGPAVCWTEVDASNVTCTCCQDCIKSEWWLQRDQLKKTPERSINVHILPF